MGARTAGREGKPARGGKRRRAGVISLGCSKNLVDTEYIMGGLAAGGWDFSPTTEEADLLLVNTCAFLDSAVEESRSAIEEAVRWKARGEDRTVVVAGCIVSRFGRILKPTYPDVDLFLLPGQIPRLEQWLATPPSRRQALRGGRPSYLPSHAEGRVLTTSPWSYLKVSDGCSNRCSYCLIPDIRGPQHSRPLRLLRRETRSLVEVGIREISLVGQDLTRWGEDLSGRDLPGLVRSLASIPGNFRLRLLYLHPSRVNGDLLRVMADSEKVFPYIDMPIQHSSARVLRAMHRHYDTRKLERLYGTVRRLVPGIALRTTIMVGHPGEGRREFQALLRFLRNCPFENLGAFVFNPREGTPASTNRRQAGEEEARERYEQVMELQQGLSERLWEKRHGTTTEALVLQPLEEGENLWLGRTAWQAPEVDGHTVIEGPSAAGRIVRVEITGSGAYDLTAAIRADDGGRGRTGT